MGVIISDKLMDDVWQRVGSRNADQIRAIQKKHQKDQKTLTKFAYGLLLELPEEPAGVGIYSFHVVLEAFQSLVPRPKAVRRPAIDFAWKLPAEVLAEKVRIDEPYAAQYLEDALVEADDVVLTETERAFCSRVVQVAIWCLHEACEKRR